MEDKDQEFEIGMDVGGFNANLKNKKLQKQSFSTNRGCDN